MSRGRMEGTRGIQPMIMMAVSVISISVALILGLTLYLIFFRFSKQEMLQSSQKMIDQTTDSLENYLMGMREISDAAYYNIIKESNVQEGTQKLQEKMNLLYESNKNTLRSLAIYNAYGSLILAEPVAVQKSNINVSEQDWYRSAADEEENMHFSAPHIQNLFDDGTMHYYKVISLSRAIELTEGGSTRRGVLLVDMDYTGIERLMKELNTSGSGQYYYLCDNEGNLIYHPRQIQIANGIGRENTLVHASDRNGIYRETFDGKKRNIIVSTVSYTGWKLIGVLPESLFTHGMLHTQYIIILTMLLMGIMLVALSRVVSMRISLPIRRLNESVLEYEAGKKPKIYAGGSKEIVHLGRSIQTSYEEIDMLMQKIVKEQNERRRTELDALQSQINPHFLYNTLDSIMWMVEGERNDDAAFMISQLAKLFRISLSKGRTIISIKDELLHAKSYMNIQKVRYKNAFSVSFDVPEELMNYCTVKLILQPILENAINYGMNGMDDSGEIRVLGRLEDGVIYLTVSDNGMGMTGEAAASVLTDRDRPHIKGSGVGMVNVERRIQLMFGEAYGLFIESEPDEGTKVTIRLPATAYTEENRRLLEKGRGYSDET